MDKLFTDASSIMTAISFLTFLGIVWWTYVHKRPADFEAAANLPFADEDLAAQSGLSTVSHVTEKQHG